MVRRGDRGPKVGAYMADVDTEANMAMLVFVFDSGAEPGAVDA
jgi:hypothetical protein